MSEENNQVNALHVAILVVIIIVVAPVVLNTIGLAVAGIYNLFQPKIYVATLTYTDGSTQTRRGTKEEMEKWMKEEKEKEAA